MKTTIISLFTAALLGCASYISGRSFDAADFIAVAFVTCLVAWTVNQYNREGPALEPLAKTVPFAANPVASGTRVRETQRLAA